MHDNIPYTSHYYHYRQILGEELFGLSVEELQNLENKLETSLKAIRAKKEQILTDEIKELNQKGNLIHEENIDLYKKLDLIRQENTDLQKRVYGSGSVNETNKTSYKVSNGYDLDTPINLQLSQPEPEKIEAPETMHLG
ncbi:unnamed protein product, partial [Ilex paraguariensis]